MIEQKLRAQQIEELKFSLSGLSDSYRLDPGNFETVDYFLTGTITEIGNSFMINLKLVDVETGVVVTSASGEIPRNEVISASDDFQAAYINPYGIGIEFGVTPYMYIYGDMADQEGQIDLTDFFMFHINLNYRVTKWLMVWGGLEFCPGAVRLTGNYSTDTDINETGFLNIGDPLPAGTYQYEKSRAPYFSLNLGLGGVWNITKEFNITGGANISMTQTFIVQEYKIPESGSSVTASHIITSNDIALWTLTPTIRFQYYLTPRVAVNIDYRFNIQLSEDISSRYVFQDGYYGEGVAIPFLNNLSPEVDPLNRVHATDFTGHKITVCVGFYF